MLGDLSATARDVGLFIRYGFVAHEVAWHDLARRIRNVSTQLRVFFIAGNQRVQPFALALRQIPGR